MSIEFYNDIDEFFSECRQILWRMLCWEVLKFPNFWWILTEIRAEFWLRIWFDEFWQNYGFLWIPRILIWLKIRLLRSLASCSQQPGRVRERGPPEAVPHVLDRAALGRDVRVLPGLRELHLSGIYWPGRPMMGAVFKSNRTYLPFFWQSQKLFHKFQKNSRDLDMFKKCKFRKISSKSVQETTDLIKHWK